MVLSAPSPDVIPVTILTGFLGSGKTTLLNHLLQQPHGRKLAVIVNEFGAVGIDGALVAGGEQFVELDNGCLCCALNEDLEKTLHALVARGGFEQLVIETTGLADPLPVAWACMRTGLSQKLRVDAVVTLVDAQVVRRACKDHVEAHDQIARGDFVVLNKIDLTQDLGDDATAFVKTINATAPIVRAVGGEVAWPLILGEADPTTHVLRKSKAHALQHSAYEQKDASISHVHHAHHQGPLLKTWSVTWSCDTKLDEERAEALAFAIPKDVYRFKALLYVQSEEGPWLLINGVANRIDLRFLTPKRIPKQSVWVFIGAQIDETILNRLCVSYLGS